MGERSAIQHPSFFRCRQAGESMTNDQGEKYDLIASGFAEMRDSFNTEQKYIDLLINHLKPGANILDVGCGSGFPIASYLIEHGFQVTGVDSSKELLKIAESKCPLMKTIFGDIRSIMIVQNFDAIVEWWCLFHIPKEDHAKIISRFASWLKQGGILEFTTGDHEYQGSSSAMLNQELNYYSHNPDFYEKALKENGFKLLLRESDQEQHLVWLAIRKE
jgi:2-polyprenyl-3-methyl-5-hydroxy-6-metoxy-1,4-benzoquinol methylase